MNVKNAVKIFFSALLVLFSILFIFLLNPFISIEEEQNTDAKKVISKINYDIIKYENVSDLTIKSLPKNLFFAIWLKQQNAQWIPIVFDKKNINKNQLIQPKILPYKLKKITRIYPEKISLSYEGSNDYIIWLNKYNMFYFLKHFILPLLFLMLTYLIIILLIEIIFGIIGIIFRDREITEIEKIEDDLYDYENNGSNDSDTSDTIEDNYDMMNEIDTIKEKINNKEINSLIEDDIETIEDIDNQLENMDTFKENDELQLIPVEDNADDDTGEINVNYDELIENYKELWEKNFKVSEDFKKKFKFEDIFNLIKFGIKPEQYITESLETAKKYFNWDNARLYIHQENNFIDTITKEILETSKVIIPQDGNKKGKIFIPLFPYNVKEIYGYFYFEWNHTEKFNISDILYFLKFFFSDKAKSIFLNYKTLNSIINILYNKLQKDNETAFSILEVDNKEKLTEELGESRINMLNDRIKERMINYFNKSIIFNLSNLMFAIISENIEKEKHILKIEKWINDISEQLYEISLEYGNIALSYSCGVSFQDKRDLHPQVLINEAEQNLKIAIQKGRNQVVY